MRVKQHFMSIRQNFEIYMKQGNVVYQVRRRMPWLRRQITILDAKTQKKETCLSDGDSRLCGETALLQPANGGNPGGWRSGDHSRALQYLKYPFIDSRSRLRPEWMVFLGLRAVVFMMQMEKLSRPFEQDMFRSNTC